MTNHNRTLTHIFFKGTRRVVSLSEGASILQKPSSLSNPSEAADGILLLNLEEAAFDRWGRPDWRSGGWVYAHTERGFLCAGAGFPNTKPLISLSDIDSDTKELFY